MDESQLCSLPTTDISTSLSKDRLKLFINAVPKLDKVVRALLVLPAGMETTLPSFLTTTFGVQDQITVPTLLKASQEFLKNDIELCIIHESFEKADIEAFMLDCSNAKKSFASAYLIRSDNDDYKLPQGFSGIIRELDPTLDQACIVKALEQRAASHEKRLLELSDDKSISSAEVKFRLLFAQLTKVVPKDLLHLNVIRDVATELSQGKAIKERRIGKGREPVKGKNGKLLLLVKSFTGEAAFEVSEQDTVDYRQLHLFDNVIPGQIVGRLYPPGEGEDGVDALGAVIKAERGDETFVDLTEALTLKQETGRSYQSIFSNKFGFLLELGAKLDISEEFLVRGDLDLHYGHIDFVGTVVVNGNVLPGFSIKSRSGIVVRGDVEQASLFCTEGNIEISGYAHGGQGSRLVSGGSVTLKIANDLFVEAREDIIVTKEAVDCCLRAYRSILLSHASLIGGQSYFTAACEIKTAGSDLGTKTELFLCNDVEVRSDYTALTTSIQEHEQVCELIDLHLGPYATSPDRVQLLNDKLRKKMEQLLKKKANVLSSLETLNKRQTELLSKATLLAPIRVNFVSYCNDGVTLYSGEEQFRIVEGEAGPFTIDFDRDSRSFVRSEYKPLETINRSEAQSTMETETKQDGPEEGSTG
ncbi:MAG: DUF342 domain-containing protein [Bdellovibrionales bacterium]|nr:DUF342 domain-containing protein [Bdellovibrionales bacterium]